VRLGTATAAPAPAPGPQVGRLDLVRVLGQGYQITHMQPCERDPTRPVSTSGQPHRRRTQPDDDGGAAGASVPVG
jgi:hypothetical protein